MKEHQKIYVEVSVDRHLIDIFYVLASRLCPTPLKGMVILTAVVAEISYECSVKKIGAREWLRSFPEDMQSIVAALLSEIEKERINAN